MEKNIFKESAAKLQGLGGGQGHTSSSGHHTAQTETDSDSLGVSRGSMDHLMLGSTDAASTSESSSHPG
jgi:hypothetical protein